MLVVWFRAVVQFSSQYHVLFQSSEHFWCSYVRIHLKKANLKDLLQVHIKWAPTPMGKIWV